MSATAPPTRGGPFYDVELVRAEVVHNLRLRVLRPGQPRSSVDHDYDHYPAMVLIEAGRQLALSGTPNPAGHLVTGVRATFEQFAELDAPVRLVARHGERWVDVNCVQDDLVVTRMSFALAPSPAGQGQAR